MSLMESVRLAEEMKNNKPKHYEGLLNNIHSTLKKKKEAESKGQIRHLSVSNRTLTVLAHILTVYEQS